MEFPKKYGLKWGAKCWLSHNRSTFVILQAYKVILCRLYFLHVYVFKLVLHMAGMHVSLAVSYPSALYPSLLYSGSRPFQLTFRFDCARYSTAENKCIFISLIRWKRHLSLLGGVVFITIRQASGAQKSAVARRCEGSELSREKKNWKHAWVIGI